MEAYEDNPLEVEHWIETLTEKEDTAFSKGYVLALHHMLEYYSDLRYKLLDKLIELDEDNPRYRLQLLSRVHVLDFLEKYYKKRLRTLEPALDS